MAAGLRPTEEFLILFNKLKAAAGDTPERVASFYTESRAVRDALDVLQEFLARSDLERRVFHGKKLLRVTPEFLAAWDEFATKWRFCVTRPEDVGPGVVLPLFDDDPPLDAEQVALLEEQTRRQWKEAKVERDAAVPELRDPDPEAEASFDPMTHDGGAAIELGIEYLADIGLKDAEPEWQNRCSISLGAYDYLTETIGFDAHDVFRRWRNLPPVFMPAHVSNRYGASDKGSLPYLLDDAVRAYVFGAPAAAIAMCRAAYDMVKRHYDREQLEKVTIFASRRFDYDIKQLVVRANEVMHNYEHRRRLTADDDRVILSFLGTIKFFVENAPAI